jgi:hypothetical protein
VNVVLPPLFFYAVGLALTIGGIARVVMLGRRDASREITDDTPGRERARRRHRTFGLIWIVMGLFLIASTAGVLRMRH